MLRTCVAILGAAAVLVAGCGGGKDSPSTAATNASPAPSSTTPDTSGAGLSKTQFIAKANAICKDTLKSQKPFSDQLDKLSNRNDVKQLAPIIDGALKASQAGFDRLRALPTPTQNKSTLEAFYVTASKRLRVEAQLGAATKAGDRATARKIGKSIDPLGVNMAKFARRYGIKDCDTAF